MTGLYGIVQDQEVNFLLEKDSSPARHAPKQDEGTVTIRGDLSNMSLGDVFQTLGMASMEGILRMRSMFESRDVYFRNGQVRCVAPLRIEARRVGRRLVDAGLISNDHLRAALLEQRETGGMLGEILVKREAITEETLQRVLTAQVEEDLYALFTWRKGSFEFYREENPEKSRKELESAHPFDINQVLLEVARRSDEWTNILEWIGDLDEIFTPLLEASHEELKDWEITVLSQVDGRRTVREIADQLLSSLFETARAFRALLKTPVIEKSSTTALLQLAGQLATAGETRRAAVVLSLTRELRELTDAGQVRQIADLYCALGEMRVASRVLSEYSSLGRKPDDVLEILRDAFRLDSGNVHALTTLKDLLGDDPDNAEERFAVDACLVDNLVEQARLEEALTIVQAMTMSRPADPAGLSRKARVLYKLGRKDDAVAALVTLAEVMRLQGRTDQLQPIYDQILKVDPSRKDVIRSLHSLHSARRSRVRRMVYVVTGIGLALAAGFLVTTRQIHASRIQLLISRSNEMLDKGAVEEAEKIATEAVKEAGTGHMATEAQSTLLAIEKRRRADENASAELVESRFRVRTEHAGNLLESGDWGGALGEYRKFHDEEPAQRSRIASIVEARLTAVAAALEEALHEATAREPVPKDTDNPGDARAEVTVLEQIYPPGRRPRLESMAGAIERRTLEGMTGELLAERLRATSTGLLTGHARADKRLAVLKARLQEDSLKDKLNPTFVAARKAEEEHRFTDAMREYETLAAEYRGDLELRLHFREMFEKYRAIVESLAALEADTSRGDFVSAQKRLRSLTRSSPDIPFARLVELPAAIRTVPAGAVVKVAGKNLGVTPVTIRFVPGANDGKPTAQLEKEGFFVESVPLDREARGEVSLLLTRKPDWTIELPGPVDQGMTATGSGRLYVPDRSGRLHRIDPASGRIIWTFASGDVSGLLFTPCEQGDRVFLASLDRSVRALSVEDGSLAWKVDLDVLVRGGPVATPAGIAIATERGTILVLDRGSGAVLRTIEGRSAFKVPLVVSHKGVVAASEDGAVRCFHPSTLAQSWATSVTGPVRTVSISQEVVIIGCEDRSIHVLSLANGKERWSADLHEIVRLAPAVSGDTVWVATERREIWRFDLLTGGNRKRVQLEDLPSSGLSVHGPVFLAGMRSGAVFAFAFDDATPAFRLSARKAVSSAPAVLPDGTIVVASEDRTVCGYSRIAEPATRPQK